ncbi:MAG: phosphodiester glycosidase family protein [Sporichthyaceae bacterium]
MHRLVLPSVFAAGLLLAGGLLALQSTGADAGAQKAAQPPASGPQSVPAKLSLGSAELPEKRTVTEVAPGIVLTTIERGIHVEGKPESGPWVVRTLTIDPKVARGSLDVARSADLGLVSKTSALLEGVGAFAGISGGFFSPDTDRKGDPMGLAISRGRVVSEPTGLGTEVSLLVDSAKNTMKVARLRWSATARNADTGRTLQIQRVNVAPSAGPSELSVITPEYGNRTPSGSVTEVLLDSKGCVLGTSEVGGTALAAGQSALQATGVQGEALRELASSGCLAIEHKVANGTKPVKLTESVSAMTGRVWLLNDGRIGPPERDLTLWKRHPRSVAGYTWDGKLVLMTIDGRLATSVGTTMVETAKVAQDLGLRDAVNLDGGRSATMSVDGRVVGGFARERAVSDALVWVPKV